MRIILITLAILVFSSCQERKTSTESTQSFTDSIANRQKAEKMVDSMITAERKKKYLKEYSEIGLPVKVISAKLVKQEYSNRKNIQLTFKNLTDKKIEAIRFEWYGENAFGEPADMGSIVSPGEGTGFTDTPLRSGKTTTSVWPIYSTDAKKILTARAYEVAFSDGSTWKLTR